MTEVYERAIEAPRAGQRAASALAALGRAAARPTAGRRRPPQRLPSLDPPPAQSGSRRRRVARRVGLGVAGVARRRPDRARGAEDRRRQRRRKHRPLRPHLGADRLRADGALALLPRRLLVLDRRARRCPTGPVRRRDVTSATMIGVLMSATLPARLGEPARAMSLARRTGRMRETFPVLLGTLVSQTVLNLVALVAARRDHRLDHRPLPLQHPEALRLQLRAAASCWSSSCSRRLLMRRNGNGRLARIGAAHAPARWSRCARGLARLPRPAPRRSPPRPPSSAPGRSSSPPAGRCSSRSASTTRPGSAPPPRCSSRSTSPRSCRRRPSNIGVFQLAVISVLHTGFGDQHRRRARLRRDPAGGRDRHRRRPRPAGPGPRGPHLERPARPGALRRAGAAQAAAPGAAATPANASASKLILRGEVWLTSQRVEEGSIQWRAERRRRARQVNGDERRQRRRRPSTIEVLNPATGERDRLDPGRLARDGRRDRRPRPRQPGRVGGDRDRGPLPLARQAARLDARQRRADRRHDAGRDRQGARRRRAASRSTSPT